MREVSSDEMTTAAALGILDRAPVVLELRRSDLCQRLPRMSQTGCKAGRHLDVREAPIPKVNRIRAVLADGEGV